MQVNRTDNHWTIQNMHHHQSSVNTPVESQLTVKKKKNAQRDRNFLDKPLPAV